MAKPYSESDTLKVSMSFSRDLALEMKHFRHRQRLTWQEFMDLALDLASHLTDDQIREWRVARYTDNAPYEQINKNQGAKAVEAASLAVEAAPAAAPVSRALPEMEHPDPPELPPVAPQSPPASSLRKVIHPLTQSASGALQPSDGQPFELGQQYYLTTETTETLYVCEADEDGDPILSEVISIPATKASA